MALDTAQKRYSMLNFGSPQIIPLFIPDGTVDSGDKYHLLNLYSGIPLSSVSPPSFSGALSDLYLKQNSAVKTIDYGSYFDNATSYSILPALPSGWSLNTSTGVMTTSDADISVYGSFVITGTNSGGNASSNSFYINVTPAYSGGSYGGKGIHEYEEEARLLLEKERKQQLAKEKQLKKEEKQLKVESKAVNQQDIRQKEQTRLKLLEVSKSLLIVKKDLTEIKRRRAKIKKRARIMRDDEEVISMLMSNGWL